MSYKLLIISIVINITLSSGLTNHSDCGVIFTKKQFVLKSTNYPENYPNNHQCYHLVKGPSCPTYYNFQFMDFDLEASQGCSKDRLEIDQQEVLCGIRNGIKTYFAPKGTLLLKMSTDNNENRKGYRILITRQPCDHKETEGLPDKQINADHSFDSNKCCANRYDSKRILISSPGFPFTGKTLNDCVYEIVKHTPNTCRLRIHFLYFNLGSNEYNRCDDHLEIDGMIICGCKSDLKIISEFKDNSIIIQMKSHGVADNAHTGFILEIFQDECPKRLISGRKNLIWSNPNNTIEKFNTNDDNTEILKGSETAAAVKVVKHYYFYIDDEDDFPRPHKEREDTTYLDKTTYPGNHLLDNLDCVNWNRRQFSLLYSQFGANLENCQHPQQECIGLDEIKGYIRSPGYPFYYPPNLNICYRIGKRNGYCKIKLHFNDFDLEDSMDCGKDYLLFENRYKFCGGRLHNTISTLNWDDRDYQDIIFRTDRFYCRRGFLGGYEQIPCDDNTENHHSTSTSIRSSDCVKVINSQSFQLDLYGKSDQICKYIVEKYTPDVCKIKLYFDKFDLICGIETLLIDGKNYCGQLTDKIITVDVSFQDIVIAYEKKNSPLISGLRFFVRGTQINDDCPSEFPEQKVPVERQIIPKSNIETNSSQSNYTYIIEFSKQFKDICGIVTNTTTTRLPETFCDILNNSMNLTKCIPIKMDSIFIPLNDQRLELDIKTVEYSDEIEFKEIDCDKMTVMENKLMKN